MRGVSYKGEGGCWSVDSGIGVAEDVENAGRWDEGGTRGGADGRKYPWEQHGCCDGCRRLTSLRSRIVKMLTPRHVFWV